MKHINFSLIGRVEAGDAVIGTVKNAAKGQDRLAVIALTEGLEKSPRQTRLKHIKREAAQDMIPLYGHGQTTRIAPEFSFSAQNEIKGSVSYPEFASETIDLLLDETDQAIIILDCQNKKSFWATMRALNVNNDDLFELAELEGLKVEQSCRKEKKPIGDAHILCESLIKGKKGKELKEARETVKAIREAKKYRTPDVDFWSHTLVAMFRRDLHYNKSAKGKREKLVNRFIRRIFPGEDHTKKIVALKPMYESLPFKKSVDNVISGRNDRFTPERSRTPTLAVHQGDVYEGLVEYYNENICDEGEDIENLLQLECLVSISQDHEQVEEVQWRQGFHFLPHKDTLLQFDRIVKLRKSSDQEPYAERIQILMQQFDNEVVIDTYAGRVDSKGRCVDYNCADISFRINLKEDKRIRSIDCIDNNSGEEVREVISLGKHPTTLILAHALSAIARIHEPDFEPHLVEPASKGVGSVIKGKFPYFEYFDMRDPFTKGTYEMVKDGEVMGTMPLHKVRSHPRRYFRQGEDQPYYVAIIPAHTRGDAANGVVSSSVKLEV